MEDGIYINTWLPTLGLPSSFRTGPCCWHLLLGASLCLHFGEWNQYLIWSMYLLLSPSLSVLQFIPFIWFFDLKAFGKKRNAISYIADFSLPHLWYMFNKILFFLIPGFSYQVYTFPSHSRPFTNPEWHICVFSHIHMCTLLSLLEHISKAHVPC